MRIWRAGAATVLVGTLALGACGTGSEPEPTDPGTGGPTEPEPTDPPETTEPEPTEPPAEGDLPGEAVDIYPYEGYELVVMGVDADDVLNIRSGPGVEYDVVAELPPLGDGIVATGHNRSLDDGGFWVEVDVDGVRGWGSVVHLAGQGRTVDITDDLGELPSGPDLVEVAQAVGALRHTNDEAAPTVTLVDGPHLSDVADVTVDVTGLGDDSVVGERLQVFAAEVDGVFTVRTVEGTAMCMRGVTDDGLCL